MCACLHMEARGQQCMPFNVCMYICMYWFLAGFKLRDLPTLLPRAGIKGTCHHRSADLHIFLNYSPLIFWARDSQWIGSLLIWLDWLANELQGASCFISLALVLQANIRLLWLLHGMLGIWIQASWLCSQYFTICHLPRPSTAHFTKQCKFLVFVKTNKETKTTMAFRHP